MDEKVRPGQAFEIAARTWNEIIDAKDQRTCEDFPVPEACRTP